MRTDCSSFCYERPSGQSISHFPPTPTPLSPAIRFLYAQVRPTGLSNYVALLWVDVCQPIYTLSNDKSISSTERPCRLHPTYVISFVLTTSCLPFFHFGSELYPETKVEVSPYHRYRCVVRRRVKTLSLSSEVWVTNCCAVYLQR